jgi:hypothetical protein
MLKAMAGMDYNDFVIFLVSIAKPRLNFIKQHKNVETNVQENVENASVFEEWKDSIEQSEVNEEYDFEDYCRFDVMTIYKCVTLIKDDESFHSLDDANIKSKIDKLLDEIKNVLGEDKETWGNLAKDI